MTTLNYWPPALPNPQINYTQETAQNRIESGFDIASRGKVIDQNHRHKCSLSWSFTERQYQVFRAWHHHTLHDGADWFDQKWLRPGRCRFADDYKASASLGKYTVSASGELDYAAS